MATLDDINIFGIPPEQPENKDDSLSRLGISESGYLNRLAQIQKTPKVVTGVNEKAEPKTSVVGGLAQAPQAVPRGILNTVLLSAIGYAEAADYGEDNKLTSDLKNLKAYINGDPSANAEQARITKNSLLTKFSPKIGATSMLADYALDRFVGDRKSIYDPRIIDPKETYRGSLYQTVPEGLGSAAAFIGTTAVNPFLGGALAMGTGVGTQAEMQDEARARGEEISLGQEITSKVLGAGIGLSEILNPLRILRIFKGLRPTDHGPYVTFLKDAVTSSGVEGGQEMLAGVLQDVTAQGIYDPKLKVGESMADDFTVGAIVGGIVGGSSSAAHHTMQPTPKLGLDISEAPRTNYDSQSFETPVAGAVPEKILPSIVFSETENAGEASGGDQTEALLDDGYVPRKPTSEGIANLIQPQPTRDYAGFISSVEKTALGPQKFGSGQDLITYLESPKRSGISTKELEYIDFDQIRNNPDLTKEDVIAHINANRPKVYRIERSEDNPTYRADENDNPLNELPYDQEASDMVNREQAAYFADEYGGELEKQNSSIINNPELQSSGFVVNSENIKNPTVLADLESFINRNPEAYSYTDRPLIKINYPDETKSIEVTATDLEGNDAYSFYQLKDVVDDGATLEFPTLKEDPFDIAQEAADLRMSPDYGGQYDVYEAVGDNTGKVYKIIGNSDYGYDVFIDGKVPESVNDLADARASVQAAAYDNADIVEGANTFDTGVNSDQFLETAPYDVFTGEATLPTRYGDDDYSRYRLPMGGAENYREFTLHIENPKTTTRYDSSKGDKHFGGGDELLHYRVSDRIDEDGKRVLFVEEIQSDLHSTASSTKSGATYETSIKERQKIANQLEEFGLTANTQVLRGYGNFFYRNALGDEKLADIGSLPSIAKEIKEGRTSKFGSKNADDFVENFGFEKTQEIGALVEKLETGNLPDFPYKGNDFIDLAVKDIMKLAAEGNYERVAFTNPATQLRRNNKDLEYIDSIEVNQVPFLTKAEQQFNEDFVRTSDESQMSTVAPTSLATESTFLDVNGKNRMRLDGPLGDADLSSFVSVNTDFVVNNPQAQKFWQDFHKNKKIKSAENYETKVSDFVEGRGVVDGITVDPANAANEYEASMKFGSPDHRLNVDYIFSKADSPLTPTQVAEELQAMGIRRAKKRRLQETQEAIAKIAKMQEATPMTNDEAYGRFLKIEDTVGQDGIEFPKKPFDQLTLDDMPIAPSELTRINQETRRGISYLMGEFRRNTLPNLDSAGMYQVNTKGTDYKVDTDKFMIERGEIEDNYRADGYADLDSMLRDLRLDKKTEAIIRKDAEKGMIPVSTTDKQVYQIEAEGGTGKKPKLIYSSLIPKSATKFAKKYNKDAEAKLKKVLYTDEYEDAGGDIIYQAYKKNLGGDDQEMIDSAIRTHEAATIDITEEMRKAILEEGVNVMYKGGIVNKVKSMDKPIQGNRREM